MNNPPELQAEIDKVMTKFQPRIDELSTRSKQMQDDFNSPDNEEAVIGVDFDVTWDDVALSFDVPSITIKDQRISFDLPEVTMVEQDWSFDLPGICSKRVVLAPGVEIDVPYPCSQTHRIVFHLPSVTMNRNEFVFGIPEVTMERVDWKVGLPQFTVRNVSVETTRMKNEADQLENDGNDLAKEMQVEIGQVVQNYLNPSIKGAQDTGTNISDKFTLAINRVSSAISEIEGAKGDPTNVPTPTGGRINLRSLLADLTTKKEEALRELHESLPAA